MATNIDLLTKRFTGSSLKKVNMVVQTSKRWKVIIVADESVVINLYVHEESIFEDEEEVVEEPKILPQIPKRVPYFPQRLIKRTKKKEKKEKEVKFTHQISSIISPEEHKFDAIGDLQEIQEGQEKAYQYEVVMTDKTMKRPIEVVDHVLVNVGKFYLSTDFVILHYAVDKEIPIITESPFIFIGRALMESEKNKKKSKLW
ncbi:hypothetical protein HAX54_028656, partial [Datura stramonium]|nr:hypothetical protein [Datura stramonium]